MNEISNTTGTPDRYRRPWVRPEDDEWQEQFAKTKQITEKGGLVALIGKRGTGKTRMACEVIRDHHPYPAAYATAMGIFLRIRASFGKGSGENESAIVDSLSRVMLLVIDEIQERAESDWENRILTHILDARYGMMRPTIIIGNLKESALGENIGNSALSRMLETGGYILMNGESYRDP